MLKWVKKDDIDDNDMWEAESCLTGEGAPFVWRLRQRVYANQLSWWEYHDKELTDDELRGWASLDEAKAFVQNREDAIAADMIDPQMQMRPALDMMKALAREVRDADELLRLLNLDPDTYRTDGGAINMPKVRAALANPGEYPTLAKVAE